MNRSTIIVVAYHGDAWLPQCIESLSPQMNRTDSLVLVDNSGNTNIALIDMSAVKTELIKTQQPLSFAEANNFALVNARELGEYVVFLNQDTKTRDDWLDACIQCLRTDPDIAAVAPMTKTYDWQDWDPYFLECARKSTAFSTAFDRGNDLARFYQTPVIPAAAMVVRRSMLQEVGPFDPIFGSYYEDYEPVQPHSCGRLQSGGFAPRGLLHTFLAQQALLPRLNGAARAG